MTHRIEFTKMHGLGNDYIYVDTQRFPISDPSACAIAWSKPHTGIGSDGLILIGRSDRADFSMRIFNADGTEAMMCGNGSRCVGKYVYDKGLTDKTSLTLDTLSGIKTLQLDVTGGRVSAVTVDMGTPLLANTAQVATPEGHLQGITLNVGGIALLPTYVCMGNPHVVIFVPSVADIDVAVLGQSIEHNPLFPERANVEFVEKQTDGSLRMRVWERGSGITQACGTGACATAVAACITGRISRTEPDGTTRPIRVVMDGGELTISWSPDDHILMKGSAVAVFDGCIDL